MTVHAPPLQTPIRVPHVSGLLPAALAAALVVGALGITALAHAVLPTTITPEMREQAYQDYRAGERQTLYMQSAIDQAWQDYRAGERGYPTK
jgi:hypothetical protein